MEARARPRRPPVPLATSSSFDSPPLPLLPLSPAVTSPLSSSSHHYSDSHHSSSSSNPYPTSASAYTRPLRVGPPSPRIPESNDQWSSNRVGGSSSNNSQTGEREGREESVATWKSDSASTARASSVPAASKVNPLMDLIRTEHLYVTDLGVIIQKAAAAWSRSCLPPPELDMMFRSAEAIYRVNRGLLARLNEIGPTPASPRQLGDLLMRWIPEIEPTYTRYVSLFSTGLDDFAPVRANAQVGIVLEQLSYPATLPPPPFDQPSVRVTMDLLFTLPFERLKYYKALYSKLLKSTQEGKSDHGLLVAANLTLDELLRGSAAALNRRVDEIEEERDGSTELVRRAVGNSSNELANSAQSSVVGSLSSNSDRDRSSASSAATTPALGPPRIEDLERRLCTDRALDIFTMLPKKCKLQMNSPNIPFTRILRRSADALVSFYPSSDPTNREVIIRQACIFLLTDLFLVCSHMTPAERISIGSSYKEGEELPDMWLMYPPLAGKHLRVAQGVNEEDLEVTVMKREKLTIRLDSRAAAREWKVAFEEAIAFGVEKGQAARTNSMLIAAGSMRTRPELAPLSMNSSLDSRSDLNSASTVDGYSTTAPSIHSSSASFALPDLPQKSPYSSNSLGLPRRNGAGSSQFSSSSHSPSSANGEHDGSQQQVGNGYNDRLMQPNNPLLSKVTPSQSDASLGSDLSNQSYSFIGFDGQNGNGSNNNGGGPPLSASSYSNPMNRGYGSNDRQGGSSNGYDRNDSRLGTRSRASSQNGWSQNDHMQPRSISRAQSSEGLRDPEPNYRSRYPSNLTGGSDRSGSAPNSTYGDARSFIGSRSGAGSDYYVNQNDDGRDSPPPTPPFGKTPDTTIVIAQMRCKIFFQQHHAQWKSLGTAKLKLFLSSPSNTKQLVVESEKGDKKTFVSTIVLTDGVEKVGKTGVAIELSDKGIRTGIVYMLQMKTEQAAHGLFDQLLLNSDRRSALSRKV